MVTKTIYLSGDLSWVKVKADKLDTKYKPNWSVTMDLDDASLNRFKENKVGVKLRENDVGELKSAQFRRYADNDYLDSEKRSSKVPPRVLILDEKGTIKTDLGMAKEFTGNVGNGSTGQVKLDTFDTKYDNKGHRLVSLLITKLVEYDPDNAMAEPDPESPF